MSQGRALIHATRLLQACLAEVPARGRDAAGATVGSVCLYLPSYPFSVCIHSLRASQLLTLAWGLINRKPVWCWSRACWQWLLGHASEVHVSSAQVLPCLGVRTGTVVGGHLSLPRHQQALDPA